MINFMLISSQIILEERKGEEGRKEKKRQRERQAR